MVAYISKSIITAYDGKGIEGGQKQYKAWFSGKSRQKLYGKYQEDVNTVLETTPTEDENENYGVCIVVE